MQNDTKLQLPSLRGTKQSRYGTDFDATQIASYLAMTIVDIFYVGSGYAGLGYGFRSFSDWLVREDGGNEAMFF